MSDIFISYTIEDLTSAQSLQQVLEDYGWKVWRDKRDLCGGVRYRKEITLALESAKCTLVLWSKHSIEKDWVLDEADKARKLEKLVPIKITTAETPSGFGQLQERDLTGWDWKNRTHDEFQALLKAIEKFVGPPKHYILDFCEEVKEKFKNGQIITLLGENIYGEGPLSTGRVVTALASEAGLSSEVHENHTLATVAEYFQSNRGRQHILNIFGDILKSQSKQCSTPAIHEAILDMPPPWFLINTNYDLLLEQRLKDKGIPFVLVSHILRSKSGTKNGWLLKVKCQGKEKSAEAYSHANELVLDPYDYDPSNKIEAEAAERRVIYKMLGTPLLQDCLEDEEWIDTLVLTETDHADFLGLMEKEASQMPDSFANALKETRKDRHILFYGYTLDYWHYRLIANIYNKKEIFSSRRRPFAVRPGMPPIEKAFWESLQAHTFAIDLDSAAKMLRSTEDKT